MIEVEVKVFLGEKENAQKLKKHLGEIINFSKQKNHYFNLDSKEKFVNKMRNFVKNKDLFEKVILGKDISIRTRDDSNNVFFIIKSAIDDTTSSNGISRIEFEEKTNLSIDELDQKILNAGCNYQAKWSREREEFLKDNITITIDKNAGYGYLAEFEIIVENDYEVESAKEKIYKMINYFGLKELDKDRLARMFDYYNNNWKNYYGTEKTFIIN